MHFIVSYRQFWGFIYVICILTAMKIHESDIKLLEEYLIGFNILPKQDIDNLLNIAQKRSLKKSDYFIKHDKVCREVVFILKGTLRSFYISDKGEEMTYCITFPGNFMTAYSSYITGSTGPENIQAMTAVDFLAFPKQKIEQLADNSLHAMRFLKVIAEQQYIELEKRLFQLQRDDALTRYTQMVQDHPDYIQQIPLKYLASYLGITQRHLSRIRKEWLYAEK